MVISKGEEWGALAEVPSNLITAPTDAELAGRIGDEIEAGRRPAVVLSPGNLLNDLGRPPGPQTMPEVGEIRLVLPVDLGWIRCDGGPPLPFIGHCRMHKRAWRGEFAVVMNGGWWGRYYLGPRAHLNDGVIDVTTGRMGLRDRIEARKRARTGTHLPHPALATARVAHWCGAFVDSTPVWVDDVRRGSFNQVEVDVQPDAFLVVV